MQFLFNVLAGAAGLYSLLIFIRIIFTWFGGAVYGKPVELLARVTDPYLDWWRRSLKLQMGFLDLSPIAGIAALSLTQTVFSVLARYGRISLGIILYVALLAIWSAASFILGFCLVIIILRFIAYITNRNIYSPFWRVIDSISQPLLYRINRIIFGRRLVNYLTGLIVAAASLGVIMIGGGFAVRLLAGLLSKLPV
jgi:YggT family protein